MRAVVFDKSLAFRDDYPEPVPAAGQALIRVTLAGICQTDLELVKGYMGFSGVLGHEFIGTVVGGDSRWNAQRVVGEINAACGACPTCRQGLGRHCPNRTTLGIFRHDGCLADFCLLPPGNLLAVPEGVSDEQAVFVEPLSAACAILEQVTVAKADRVVVIGDGKLGILCAWVMATTGADVTLIGHHRAKLDLARWHRVQTRLEKDPFAGQADLVIEATGSHRGLAAAIGCCRPRGKIVLKTTVAGPLTIDLAPVVINEITIVGSRCGRFQDGLKLLADHPDLPLDRLISACYPIEQACQAFDHAGRSDTLKVLVRMAP